MTNNDKTEFLNTPKGQYNRYLWRRRQGRSYYSFKREPPPKAIKLEEKIEFQHEVLRKMRKSQRKSYRSKIVAALRLTPTMKDPPHIHTTTKKLIDIFKRPLTETGIKRKGLIYQDDNQIACLSVRYDLGKKKKEISAQFAPLNHFLQDLKLANDILNREYIKFSDLNGFEEDDYQRHLDNEDPANDLKDWKNNKDEIIRIWGKKAYNSMLKMNEMRFQEKLLKDCDLCIADLYHLYMPYILGNEKSDSFMKDIQSTVSGWINNSPFRIQLPGIPVKDGEKRLFKEKVRKAFKEYLKKYKIYEHLHIPVNLQVIYKPPLTSHEFFKDLDNLMRLILPIFNEEFKPPPNHVSKIELDDIKDKKLFDSIKRMIDRLPKSVKHSVKGYDVFEIPRQPDDKKDGFINVGISSATISSPFYKIDKVINRLEKCYYDI